MRISNSFVGAAAMSASVLFVGISGDAAAEQSVSGTCYRGMAWHGFNDKNRGAGATLTPCNQEEPADTIALRCSNDARRINVEVDYVPPSGNARAPSRLQITVDGRTRRFAAKLNSVGMYETMNFTIDRDDPLIERLAAGRRGSIRVGSKRTRFHLRGSRKAISILRRGCGMGARSRGTVVSTRGYVEPKSRPSARVNRRIMRRAGRKCWASFRKMMRRRGYVAFAVARNGGCGYAWENNSAAAARKNAMRSCRQHGRGCRIAMTRARTPFRMGKTCRGDYARWKTKSNETTAFAVGNDGACGWSNNATSMAQAERIALAGCRKHSDDCRVVDRRRAEVAQAPAPSTTDETDKDVFRRLAEKPAAQEPKRSSDKSKQQPVNCGDVATRVAAQTARTNVNVLGPQSTPHTIGEPTTFRWSFGGRLDDNCRRPVYLVVTTPKRTRFEGTGFLAIPGGQPGPFGIKHNQEQTRLFFPLHLLDERHGEFKIKSYEVGPLDIEWALVQPKARVANPRTRRDFAPGQEYVSDTTNLANAPRYTVGEPKLLVRDNFTLEKPKKVIRSNSGEFDLQVFDLFYRVLDARTGELLIERAGVDPNFSPGSRFVGAFVEADMPAEVIDLYARRPVYRGEAYFLAWGHGDAFLAPGEAFGTGAGRKSNTALKAQQSLVDHSAIIFKELVYYKTWPERWLLSLDLEAGLIGVHAINPHLGSDYDDNGKAWSSLLKPSFNSVDLVANVYKKVRACFKRPNSVYGLVDREECSRRIMQKASSALRKHEGMGFFSARQLFNATRARGAAKLSWFLNRQQLSLSHACASKPGSICAESKLNKLKIAHKQTSRFKKIKTRSGVVAASRLVETRSKIRSTRKQTASDNKNKMAIYARLSRLGVPIASTDIGGEKVFVPSDDDWWDKVSSNVRKLKSYIVKRNAAAARTIPDGSVALKVEWRRTGPCYRKADYAGTATQQPTLPSHRISQGIELSSKSYQAWIFQPGCSNGAEARHSFWLLVGARDGNGRPRAQLVDVSFDLRFKVGDRPSGRDADGTLQTHRELGNTLGFGSWPQSVDFTAIASDRYLLAHGTWPGGRWALVFDLETRKVITFIRNVENADDFGALALTKDGGALIQANTNGQLFFYDTATGKVVLRGVETDDELIVYNDDGYYVTNEPEGGQFLYLKFPGVPGYSAVRQFAATLNRPDLIKTTLSGGSALPKPELTAPPALALTSKVAGRGASRQVTLTYEAASEVGLKQLVVYVDGHPVRRRALTGARQRGEITVPVPARARWVSAVAIDQSDFESVPRGAELPAPAAPEASRLFVISAGNDTYDHLNQLGGTKTDATNFVRMAESSKGRLYSDVVAVPLLDERDLRTRLLGEIRSAVARAGANDTIMLFAAGHGLQGRDGRFYLTTPATLPDQVEKTSIAWQDIAAAFAGTKARVVVFLDACQSGAAATNTGSNDEAVAALFERSVPITVIAASKGRQDSAETADGNAGEFTASLLRAVVTNRSRTDTNNNGAIELAELYGVVKRDVVTRTRRRNHDQTPWVARNQMIGEVPLF